MSTFRENPPLGGSILISEARVSLSVRPFRRGQAESRSKRTLKCETGRFLSNIIPHLRCRFVQIQVLDRVDGSVDARIAKVEVVHALNREDLRIVLGWIQNQGRYMSNLQGHRRTSFVDPDYRCYSMQSCHPCRVETILGHRDYHENRIVRTNCKFSFPTGDEDGAWWRSGVPDD